MQGVRLTRIPKTCKENGKMSVKEKRNACVNRPVHAAAAAENGMGIIFNSSIVQVLQNYYEL